MMKQKYLLRLFILTLSLSIFLGSVSSSYSQNPSSNISTKQMVIKEIKGYAQRHVDNNENMKTEVIIEIYKDNTIGLTKVTIAEIYETEYVRIKQQKSDDNNNFWNKIPKDLSDWIVIVFGVMGTIYGVTSKVVNKWITTIIDKTGKWIYTQLSGLPFFEDINLKSYRQALIEKYEKLKIPFRPNYPQETLYY